MKLLYIGNKQDRILHGWDQVNKRNQIIVERIFDRVDYLPLDSGTLESKVFIGVTNGFLNQVIHAVEKGYDYVFVCQSTCGRVCRFIRKRFPKIKIITFFHNIERHYAEQYLKVSGIKAISYYLRAFVFEKLAVKYSDYCITLNERDSRLLMDIYGKHANAIMPTSLEDKFLNRCVNVAKNEVIIDYLFVGTSFYPNVEGMQWFIDNIMPKVPGTLTIVGKGMRKDIFNNIDERINIYGFVEDLSDLYRRARCIVSPIFHGGGMKTKTAEALMYGKLIVATKEAFEGYVIDRSCMLECNTIDDFIKTLTSIKDTNKTFYSEARRVFCKHCSYDSSERIFRSFLNL